jgi:hypothetical protein
MRSPEKKSPKKAYKSPVLETYGDIRQITKNAGNTSLVNDKGGGGKTKTG